MALKIIDLNNNHITITNDDISVREIDGSIIIANRAKSLLYAQILPSGVVMIDTTTATGTITQHPAGEFYCDTIL